MVVSRVTAKPGISDCSDALARDVGQIFATFDDVKAAGREGYADRSTVLNLGFRVWRYLETAGMLVQIPLLSPTGRRTDGFVVAADAELAGSTKKELAALAKARKAGR